MQKRTQANSKGVLHGTPPADTQQAERDAREKSKHERSENELPSTQDKNPIPPGTTRSS
ncbi:hypothetical protein [Paraburkholderia unamae]|uniref:Uncharacterized protein n=1 Tax=Paraburkholderia unamae TaxID=219649 RepID=A0ABX5KJ03_9BURK|nr:hypothetical protein [Paraburkholderia unamae]PVX81393.1 hypothetical protein C7402_111295 [Paraburkholderia unamae]RAR54643.1 hypothetical protein C7401_124140 [Paraburkholderia unamae]